MPQPKTAYDPVKERARVVADRLWEKAVQLANILAPDTPADHERLPDDIQWRILEQLAMSLSPAAWDDPEAIMDLYNLRKKFAPMLAYEWMPQVARSKKSLAKMKPRVDITPENPEYDRIMKRLVR